MKSLGWRKPEPHGVIGLHIEKDISIFRWITAKYKAIIRGMEHPWDIEEICLVSGDWYRPDRPLVICDRFCFIFILRVSIFIKNEI